MISTTCFGNNKILDQLMDHEGAAVREGKVSFLFIMSSIKHYLSYHAKSVTAD